jgi:hypothetical protein
VPHQILAPRVNDNEALVLQPGRPLDVSRGHRVIFVGVRANDQDTISLLQLREGIGHRPGAIGGGQTGHRGAVSETGAVIHMIGTYTCAQEFLHEVVLCGEKNSRELKII